MILQADTPKDLYPVLRRLQRQYKTTLVTNKGTECVLEICISKHKLKMFTKTKPPHVEVSAIPRNQIIPGLVRC